MDFYPGALGGEGAALNGWVVSVQI